jgi:hypothetical protein
MWRAAGELLLRSSSTPRNKKIIYLTSFLSSLLSPSLSLSLSFSLYPVPPVNFLRLMMVFDRFFLISLEIHSPGVMLLANSRKCVSDSSATGAILIN